MPIYGSRASGSLFDQLAPWACQGSRILLKSRGLRQGRIEERACISLDGIRRYGATEAHWQIAARVFTRHKQHKHRRALTCPHYKTKRIKLQIIKQLRVHLGLRHINL
jgi:hypothetical protein